MTTHSLPTGFSLSSMSIGLRDRLDTALIVADEPATTAAVFTQNTFCAAPVKLGKEHLRLSGHKTKAIMINAVSANAGTGKKGYEDAVRCADLLANEVCHPVEQIIVCSTGKIGYPLPMEKFEMGISELVSSIDDDIESAAKAIMTTDTCEKISSATVGDVSILGIAKGSGMIHPNMATMLAYVLTDATVDQKWLQETWHEVISDTFNMISVDASESTNDSAFVLASNKKTCDLDALKQALYEVAKQLAIKIIQDGEGATMLVECTVNGVDTKEHARTMARSVICNDLLKCAIHGKDPNWGRILAALGQTHLPIDMDTVDVSLNSHLVYEQGVVKELQDPSAYFDSDTVTIVIDLHAGNETATAWGCDLSKEYIDINALYTT